MSSNKNIEPVLRFTGTVTSPTVAYSSPIDIKRMIAAAAYVSIGAGLTCKVSMQGSLDGTNFTDLGNIPVNTTVGPDTMIFDVYGTAVNFIRVKVTPTAGAGAVSVYMSAKGI